MAVYRIIPGWLNDFNLQKRFLWVFWLYVKGGNDFGHLRGIVERTGGKLTNPEPEDKP